MVMQVKLIVIMVDYYIQGWYKYLNMNDCSFNTSVLLALIEPKSLEYHSVSDDFQR